MTPKRLIELSLPLAAISEQSAREKSIRHGHISTLHIWWARRPLAAMRAAIFASLLPAPADESERKRLEELIAAIVDWDQVKDGNSEAILEARRRIREAFPDGAPRLLDPFMGGGATGLEALRLGCETHAVELNPVAHIIELCTLVYPQQYGQPELRLVSQGAVEVEQKVNGLAADVRKWGEWVLARAREEIGHLYENPASDATIVGYLWARTVQCPNPTCRADMPLVRQWWLAKRPGHQLSLKPVVDRERKQISYEVVDLTVGKNGAVEFDPSDGTVSKGHATCLVCGQVADVDYIREEGLAGRMWDTPLAVIYDTDGAGKGYRSSTSQDWAQYQQARSLLAQFRETIPSEPIPTTELRRISVPIYGLDNWGKLFNDRQAVALSVFSRLVRQVQDELAAVGVETEYAKAVATYLALVLDRLANQGANLARWNNTGEKIEGVFARQAIGMIWDYVECNPFSGATGDWLGAIDWVTRVIEHASLSAEKPAKVLQGTATRLPYLDGHFDVIITDPPYYDSVPYSHLADFFYVWLKRSIGDLYPHLFRTPLTPKGPEIVQDRPHSRSTSTKDAEFYEREMTKAFAEARRVLSTDGIFVVVFAHKSTAAWETLLNSLLDAELVVTASWPLHTEMASRLRAQGTASLASSIFIVCRVRVAESEGYFDDVRQELATTIRERLDFFWSQGIRGADFFISAIGPAVSVFGRYSRVHRLDGSEVTVGELLDLIQSLVSEYALDRILNGAAERMGGVDAATRYYILHRWAYADESVPFDDAMRLAMALGADVSALMERNSILSQSSETVRLQGPQHRRKIDNLGLPDRSGKQASIIDVLHRAAALWESGNRSELARFLGEAAQGREEKIRLVAQTLVNILPEDDSERRLLEGFLIGRDALPDLPRQDRLL